jgi:hypothetical protein
MGTPCPSCHYSKHTVLRLKVAGILVNSIVSGLQFEAREAGQLTLASPSEFVYP